MSSFRVPVSVLLLLAAGILAMFLVGGPPSRRPSLPSATRPVEAAQLAELKGVGSFGAAVAISGTTAVIGAPTAEGVGRAYVFTKTASGWTESAELKGSDTVAGDEFGGSSVAISGTTALVGAYAHAQGAGRAYVFTKTASGWTESAELKGSDTVAGDAFGISVGVSGANAVVGACGAARLAGRAYVFTKTAAGWIQTAELWGRDTVAPDAFGGSVAISGPTIVVGSFLHRDGGRAYVFTETAAGWTQTAELKGSDTVTGDGFGTSVGSSGEDLVVGDASRAHEAGRAYVFTKTAAGWIQTAELRGSDTVAGDHFGIAVALSGTTAVAGAASHSHDSGRAYVFTRTAAGWTQVAELKGGDTAANNEFGISVGVSGAFSVVGAPQAHDVGRTYLFEVLSRGDVHA